MSGLEGIRVGLLTVSDRVAEGSRPDVGGQALAERVEGAGGVVVARLVVADERPAITAAVGDLAARADVVLTSGGTGLGPRDVTPEATREVLDREAPGIAEALRRAGMDATPFGMLSRGLAGLVGRALVINLPGNPRAVGESWVVLEPVLAHAVRTARGPVRDDAHRAPPRPP
ncbi:MAG TPA: MogA/MoaB family molybdenum cofactor biosynthesis protein [Actinomycetes bacterium]|nr:MogA/MoaB family molybdenum cofactor biosynthesis protein [Actinomycetes bacterium]